MGSQATRDADGVLFTRAGLEIGVAATKTFVAQVAAMYLLGAQARAGARNARARGAAPTSAHELRELPHAITELLEQVDEPVRADRRATGRTPASSSTSAGTSGLPVCLEGALKLKEISYIPTDAYAAGEMKHGPIALLDEHDAGGVRGHRLAGARQGALEHRRGARARRPRDRGGHRGQRRRSAEHAEEVVEVPPPTGCSSRSSP